jgi:hypothetical protein
MTRYSEKKENPENEPLEESPEFIPERTRRLFWDAEPRSVDKRIHRSYIVRRIMDYGNMEDVKWMLRTYSTEEIIDVLKKSRGLSPKSACFWSAYFNLAREEIACLNTPFRGE